MSILLRQRGGLGQRHLCRVVDEMPVRVKHSAALSGCFSLKLTGWAFSMYNRLTTCVDTRGGVWGEGEQLWDWKAWRGSVLLSEEES